MPEPPVNAVKNAQAKTVTTAGPPRRCPVQARSRRTRRLAAPVAVTMKPASVKSGSVESSGLTTCS